MPVHVGTWRPITVDTNFTTKGIRLRLQRHTLVTSANQGCVWGMFYTQILPESRSQNNSGAKKS